jgi:parvulin-like peptidyl-prolyl isomerase
MSSKVHCAHILVKSEKDAKEVLEKLKKGEKFSAIAKSVSRCSSRKNGGDLGFFTRGKMVKEFEKTAFALNKGETSAIVKTQFGYHIIKRLE